MQDQASQKNLKTLLSKVIGNDWDSLESSLQIREALQAGKSVVLCLQVQLHEAQLVIERIEDKRIYFINPQRTSEQAPGTELAPEGALPPRRSEENQLESFSEELLGLMLLADSVTALAVC